MALIRETTTLHLQLGSSPVTSLGIIPESKEIYNRGLYRGFRDKGYLPFYFQGYRILSILLPGIWDTWFNIFVTSRDIENLGKLIMGIFADL